MARGAATELGEGDRVEGAGAHACPPLVAWAGDAERVQPTSELARGLACEGDRQDVRGLDSTRGDLPGDAVGEHPGLARSRAGQDREGCPVGRDRVALCGIEALEEPLGVHPPDGTDGL